MAECMKNWLRERLGILVDLRPDVFGAHARDGTLLAKLLESYDAIDAVQLGTIVETTDPALCRVNLKHLRVWLRFFGVVCTDRTIDEISRGKGTAALRLFYEVYQRLESTDNLYLVTRQKNRETYVATTTRFDVRKVPEESSASEPDVDPLAELLAINADNVDWHRKHFPSKRRADVYEYDKGKVDVETSNDNKPLEWQEDKRQAIIDACKRERDRFQASRRRSEKEKRLSEMRKRESKEIDRFARRHEVKTVENPEDIFCRQRKNTPDSSPPETDPDAARQYVRSLKDRRTKARKADDEKLKMHKLLLDDVWKKFLADQDEELVRLLARRATDQSRFEKQMIAKVYETRSQMSLMMRNRRMAEEMKQELVERELRLRQACEEDNVRRRADREEMERQRANERRVRIDRAKVTHVKEKHRRVCLEILYDLIDLAILSAKYRETNNEELPKTLWKSWVRLVLQGQSTEEIAEVSGLFRPERRRGGGGEGEETIQEGEIAMKVVHLENERNYALDETEFMDYHNFEGFWREHVPEIDSERQQVLSLGSIVLGYVVHRLLEFIYPYPSERVERPVPQVRVAAIVTGIEDETHYAIIQDLLEKSGIRVVLMEDAINYCLQMYKDEMKDFEYIDFSFAKAQLQKKASKETTRKAMGGKVESEKSASRRKSLMKVSAINATDKQTQTPREIPYDDVHPDLSEPAYIGKWTHEFLMLGQPISNELNTKILLEYLKSLKDVKGWVLLNYPDTYEQMARLESALTKRTVPPDPKGKELNEGQDILDPLPAKIVFEDYEVDEFALCRQSRLLPNPRPKAERLLEGSFITIYVKVMPTPKNLVIDENEVVQVLPEDATSIDNFYANRNIAHVIYYTTLDLETLKTLARFLIGDLSVPRKPSGELFGDVVHYFQGDKEIDCSSSRSSVMKLLAPKPNKESRYSRENNQVENMAVGDYLEESLEYSFIRPGEKDWEWVDLPQDPSLLEIMATFWEYLEDTYIDNLKDVLFLKRVYFSGITPYKSFVMSGMKRFIARPDIKQDLLEDFHRSFNDMEEDMREDDEVKCELHCRVDDFRTALWNVCDDRKREAEEERKRLINDHWTYLQAVALVNVYIGFLQAEVDRFIDTIHLVQDYYASMLQRPLGESQFSKVFLNNIAIKDQSSKECEIDSKRNSFAKQKDSGSTRLGRDSRDSASPPHVDRNLLREEIASMLLDTEGLHEDLTDNSCYIAILDNIEFVRKTVETVSSAVKDVLKKEETAPIKEQVNIKDTMKNVDLSSDSFETKLAQRKNDLLEEWRFASMFEINRISVRLDLLSQAAKADITFLLNTMRQTFQEIHKQIVERYKREVQSVNDAIAAFCWAIEESSAIQREMFFDGDRFTVNPSALMYPDPPKSPLKPVEERFSPSEFRIARLGRLHDAFRRIASDGHMAATALVYVLQDYVSLAEAEEEDDMLVLPESWYRLDPCDVRRLVAEIFGGVDRVDWREFLVYATGLPMPSCEEILRAREHFRARDPALTETVTSESYRATPLWFHRSNVAVPEAQCALYEDFERDEECLERDLHEDFLECGAVAGIAVPEEALRVARSGVRNFEDVVGDDNDLLKPEEAARMILAKEFLFHLYLVGKDTVNYTALLLAFCKDDDPRQGFAKALSLVVGNRVCSDVYEGEKYVDDLYELTHRCGEDESLYAQLEEKAQVSSDSLQQIPESPVKRMTIKKLSVNNLQKLNVSSINAGETNERDPSNSKIVKNDNSVEIIHRAKESLSSSIDEDESERKSSSLLSKVDFVPVETDDVVTYWIPKNVCMAVLSAALPWHAMQTDLFNTSMSLRELVDSVYADLQDPELKANQEAVLAHRLINHRLILEVLRNTTKFTNKNMSQIVEKILNDKDNVKNTR